MGALVFLFSCLCMLPWWLLRRWTPWEHCGIFNCDLVLYTLHAAIRRLAMVAVSNATAFFVGGCGRACFNFIFLCLLSVASACGGYFCAKVDSVEHCDKFWYWLQAKGINSNRSGIVNAIAEKVNTWIPGEEERARITGEHSNRDQ